MLTHLYDNYGIITAVDIENNYEEMRTPYNPALPIESLFHQIEVTVEFAEAGKIPYEKAQVVSRAYLLILRTGLYQEACHDWDKQLDPDKTWKYFKIFFTTAHRDLRLMQTTAKQTGFHTNNAYSMQSHAPEDDNEENDIAVVITELANAATKDKDQMLATFTDLPNTIKALQKKLKRSIRKVEVEREIPTMRVIAGLMAKRETTITKVVLVVIKKKGIKVTQLYPIARTDRINGVIVNDNWGKL